MQMTETTHRYRIHELAELSRDELGPLPDPADRSKRVRWKPTPRLVRFYSTRGLVDRPAEMRGRTAFYGPRHLLQLLAIKALQAAGLSLAEVQAELAGASDALLRTKAGLPGDWRAPPPGGREAAPPSRDQDFWTRAPSLPASAPPVRHRAPDETAAPPRPSAQAFDLAPGVTLLLDTRLAARVEPARLAAAAAALNSALGLDDERAEPTPTPPRKEA